MSNPNASEKALQEAIRLGKSHVQKTEVALMIVDCAIAINGAEPAIALPIVTSWAERIINYVKQNHETI